MSEAPKPDEPSDWPVDVLLVLVMLFGVWPLADPGHALDTAASIIDVALHWAAAGWLAVRWRIVRRRA